MRILAFRRWTYCRGAGALLGLAVLLWPSAARAQSIPGWQIDATTPPDLGLGTVLFQGDQPSPGVSPQRIRIFRFAPGFLSDPVGLQDVDDTPPGSPSQMPSTPAEPDNGPDWIQVAMGADNPYFDFRQRGDPGGLGYYRLNTQVQLLDTSRTACTIGVQAVAPAGLQYLGVQDGPMVLSPQFGLFHTLDDNTAVQGFVGKHMLLNAVGPQATPVERSLQYGMALQRSLASVGPDSLRNVYVFMGALGEYRPERNENAGGTALWKMLPGIHWRLTESWWLSGGVMLPVGPARADTSTALPWQFTCSFQF